MSHDTVYDLVSHTAGLNCSCTANNVSHTFISDSVTVFIREFNAVLQYKHFNEFMVSKFALVSGVFGLLGYVFLLLILLQEDFGDVGFVYHKAIGGIELIYCACLFWHWYVLSQKRPPNPTHFGTNFWGAFFEAHFSIKFTNLLNNFCDLITIFSGIDRTLALFNTPLFKRFNRVSVARLSVAISFLAASLLALPTMIFQYGVEVDSRGNYFPKESTFWRQSSAIRIYRGIQKWSYVAQGVVISILMCSIVVGLMNVARRRHSLTERNRRGVSYLRSREFQLCLLQILLSAPLTVNLVIFCAAGHFSPLRHITVETVRNDEPTAWRQLKGALMREHLQVAAHITSIFVHSYNFYMYACFSRKIRSGFKSLVYKCRGLPDSSSTTGGNSGARLSMHGKSPITAIHGHDSDSCRTTSLPLFSYGAYSPLLHP